MNRIIQMEVNHATGKLLADVEFTIKVLYGCKVAQIKSITSPVTGWDMLEVSESFSDKEMSRIYEVCRNA